MENRPEIPPGWELTVDEVSSNVYEVRLTWDRGPLVETKGTDVEGMVAWCVQSARTIEDLMRRRDLFS